MYGTRKKIVKNKQNRAKKTQFVFQLKSIGDPHLHCNSQVRACSTKCLYWCFCSLSLVLREQRSQTEGGRFRPHYTHGGPPTGLQGPRFLGLIMTLLPPIPQKRNSPARLSLHYNHKLERSFCYCSRWCYKGTQPSLTGYRFSFINIEYYCVKAVLLKHNIYYDYFKHFMRINQNIGIKTAFICKKH